jgi:peptidoglycan-N-acetylglucosamine deacetylase
MGFKIQNHSYSHPHFSSITLQKAVQEITKTDEILSAIYKSAGLDYNEKWFRFPYGDKGDGKFGNNFGLIAFRNSKKAKYIQNFLKELGYTKPRFNNVNYQYLHAKRFKNDIDVDWTFDVMEWALIEQNMKGLETIQCILKRIENKSPRDYRRIYATEKRWLGNKSSAEIILLHDHFETGMYFKTIIDSLIGLGMTFASF